MGGGAILAFYIKIPPLNLCSTYWLVATDTRDSILSMFLVLQTPKMAEPLTYLETLEAFNARGNSRTQCLQMISSLPQYRQELKVEQSKNCLAIGAGDGIPEIHLVNQLMPQLESLVVVEPDKASAAKLRVNLQRDLPNVKVIIHEKTAEEFFLSPDEEDCSSAFDVALMFHVLYFISDEDRPKIFRKLFDKFIRYYWVHSKHHHLITIINMRHKTINCLPVSSVR